MPALLLLVLFVVVPLAELYVLIQVGQAIGALPTIGLLLLDSVLGTLLMKTQGAAAWRRFNEALAAGRLPHKEVADGFLVILGGALLLAPGFLTDVIGVLLLLPPTRALIRPVILRVLVRRALAGGRGPGGGAAAGGGGFAFGRGFPGGDPRAGSSAGGDPRGGGFPGGDPRGGFPGGGGARPGFGFGGGAAPGGRRRPDDGDVVDGTAHDVDPKHLP